MRQCTRAIMVFMWSCVPVQAWCSSDDAWSQFRQDVEATCLAAIAGVLEDAVADVDPFGSPSYGLAVVHGKEKGGGGSASVVCVYDKRARTVEIGSAIDEADD